MADGTTTQRVVYELDVKPGANMAQPFNSMAQEAKRSKEVADQAKGSFVSMSNEVNHGAHKADRSVRFLTQGVFGLGASLGMVDERAGKALGAILAIHSGVEVIRGLAGITGILAASTAAYVKTLQGSTTATIAEAAATKQLTTARLALAGANVAGGVAGGGSLLGGAAAGAGGAGAVKGAAAAAGTGMGALLLTSAAAGVVVAQVIDIIRTRSLGGNLGLAGRTYLDAWRQDESIHRQEVMHQRFGEREERIRDEWESQKPYEEVMRSSLEMKMANGDRFGAADGRALASGAMRSAFQSEGQSLIPRTPSAFEKDQAEREYEAQAQRSLAESARGYGERGGEAASKTYMAQQKLGRSGEERLELEKELNEIQSGRAHSREYEAAIAERLGEAQKREIEDAVKYSDALKEQNTLREEGLRTQGQMAKEAENHYRQLRIQTTQNIKSGTEELAMGSPAEQNRLLNVMRKLAAGPGAAQAVPPQMRWDAKAMRNVFDPGSPGGLSVQEIGIAKQHTGLTGDLLSNYFGQLGGKNQTIQEIMRLSGQTAKRDAAIAGEKAFENLRVGIENKIEAEIKINEKSLAEQLEKVVVPKLLTAIEAAKTVAAKTLERKEYERQRQSQAK